MAISFACPISGEQRDNNTVRIVAAQVVVIAVVALVVAQLIGAPIAAVITGLLGVDFIIRAFVKPKYSPLATLGRGISSGLRLPKKMVDSAPKVFAARIGVLFTVSTTILYAAGLTLAGTVVLAILIICAVLESALGFCVGCQVYSLLPKRVSALLVKGIVRQSAGSQQKEGGL